MTEEFSNKKEDLIKKVSKINWWEWIPVLGGYLFFARINFAKVNFVKDIRKAVNKYFKFYQLFFAILSLPFVIWTIVLWVQYGWGFKLPLIGVLISFGIQFFSAKLIQLLFLKGLKKLTV